MPSRDIHLDFDNILKQRRIVAWRIDTDPVHTRLDYRAKRLGPLHRELDPKHSVLGVYRWLHSVQVKYNLDEATLTNLLRVALGHLVVDEMDALGDWSSDRQLFRQALYEYKRRSYDQRRFQRYYP